MQEPKVTEEIGHGMMGLAHTFRKGPVSVDIFDDPNLGENGGFTFWVNWHDGQADMGWDSATLEEAMESGRQALDDAWERYVAEGEQA